MRIFIGQIYLEVGVGFPFSIRFQQWLGNALSERVEVSKKFVSKFGSDFTLGLRISAKEEIERAEIRGPSIFKKDKCVEFTIFLPFLPADHHDPEVASLVVVEMLQSAVLILKRLGLESISVESAIDDLRSEFLVIPGLLDEAE